MASSTRHHHNQLLFNLNVPAMPTNMAVKFQKPEALVLEKFGPTLTPMSTAITAQPSMPAFQFSAVSQDKLSVALQLVKRDMKQKKLDESLRSLQEAQREKEQERKSRPGAGIQARYLNVKKGANNKDIKVSSMGRSHSKDKKSSATKWSKPQPTVLHVRHSNVNNSFLPVSGMSPPTRDIDPDPHLSTPNPHDQKSLQEIKHLRSEINQSLDQILKLEEAAHNGSIVKRRLRGEDDLQDDEVARRRAQRSTEQASRSARLVYDLQQHVKEIQHDMDKLRPGTVKPNKKTKLLSRLAAAHRGAIRALQAFVTQLEDHDWSRGLPRTHQELTLLVRQLALCCAQLEVAGQSAVPESVKNLIKDMAEYNIALEKEFHSSPPRSTRPRSSVTHHQVSPSASRQLFTEDGAEPAQKRGAPVRREIVTGMKIDKSKKSNRAPQPGPSHSSPERESILRQGIAALMRAAESPGAQPKHKVPPLNLPRTPRAPRYSAYDKHVMQKNRQAKKKGVIIPAELKAKRERAGSALPVYTREGHFSEPTVSSRLKEVPVHERPAQDPGSPKSHRHPSRSPMRGHPSPHTPRQCARSLSPRPTNTSPGRYTQREIERQVLLDREASKQLRDLELLKRKELQEIEKLRKEMGKPDHYVEEAEKRIRERLRPLLEKAQEIEEKYEALHGRKTNGARHTNSARNTQHQLTNDVELNADILSELILQDLTQEVAEDLGNISQEAEVELEARRMQQAPSIEQILQRLSDMENEQHEIRRRYATISYEDELPGTVRKTAYFDTDGQDRPTTPPPIQVDKTTQDRGMSLSDLAGSAQSWHLPTGGSLHRPAEEEGAILFTKPQHQVRNFHIPQHSEPKHEADRRIRVSLSDEMMSNILNSKERYSKFLKRTSTQSVGRFNPWQVVEQVSDEILDECLQGIAAELEDINSDIVNHVYHAEFKEVKTVPLGEEMAQS